LQEKNAEQFFRLIQDMLPQLNCKIAAIRIKIEHPNAKFKTFQIIAQPYRNRKKRFTLRAELICDVITFEEN